MNSHHPHRVSVRIRAWVPDPPFSLANSVVILEIEVLIEKAFGVWVRGVRVSVAQTSRLMPI